MRRSMATRQDRDQTTTEDQERKEIRDQVLQNPTQQTLFHDHDNGDNNNHDDKTRRQSVNGATQLHHESLDLDLFDPDEDE